MSLVDKYVMRGDQDMNNTLKLHGIKCSITVEDEVIEARFDALDCFVSNDGIGGYEFWGMKGNDTGHDYVEDFRFSDVRFFSEEGNQVGDPDLCDMFMQELESSDEAFEAVNAAFDEMIADPGI